ncbi:MAG: flagellar basal body-associated FliL family protein [Deltaproteobacteria bacterium]|jgi:flagellar FliL protein|nr:flagellar basal body-associated FliL family protein [Deltaproteobacteria bacterium]
MSEKKNPKEAPPKTENAAPEAKGGGKTKLLIIALAAMIIGGAGAFVLLKTVLAPAPAPVTSAGQSGETAPAPKVDDEDPIVAPTKGGSEVGHASGGKGAAGAEGAPAVPATAGPTTVELKPFTTNLNEPSGRRFLKVTIGLEVDNQEAVDELNKKMSDIQDSVLILLSSQSIEDISSVDGKERLRGQILNRVNGFMANNKVKKVKYSDFIVQ